jgi:hypothetical protein
MIRFLLNFYLTLKIRMACHKKWKHIILSNESFSVKNEIQEKHLHLWKPLSRKVELYYLNGYTQISTIESHAYTPENLYYEIIEPVLNNKSFSLAYSDKNFYQRFLSEFSELFPITILRSINKTILNSKYDKEVSALSAVNRLEENTSYIFKSSVETSGGQDVFCISRKADKILMEDSNLDMREIGFDTLAKSYPNFIIQEKITQNQWFSNFNKSSVNTLRVFTYRSWIDESVHVLSCVLRFGQKGKLVDNQAAGGLTIGINKEGLLNNFVCSKYGRINDTEFDFSHLYSFKVPFYDKIIGYAKRIAPSYYYHRLLGFDFCVTANDEIRLLEINCKNIEINFLQMNNGPLFGEFTNEIIEYCRHENKKVVIDFELKP